MASIFTSDETKLSTGMKIALCFSMFFHIGVLIAGMVGLPYITKPIEIPAAPIAVDIVDISELTTTNKPPAKNLKKPEKPKEALKKEEKKVQAPPKVEAKEPPKIAPIKKPPEPKKDTVKPKPKTPPPPSEKLEKVEKPPKPKKEEKKEEAVEQEDLLLSLMKNLQESEDSSEVDGNEKDAAENAPDAPVAEYVTAHELNALANQLISCWQIPIGAKNVNDMVVKVRIWANADRTVKKVEIEDKWRMANDPAFRALAESAKRAVLDPYCSPLEIPEEKYKVWKDQYIVVPFDPSRVT